jgi:predicted NUDIX family phosphoesterase
LNSTETVLCIEKKDLPRSWTQPVSVVPADLSHFIDACTLAGYCFVNRAEAEDDPSKKQIIPYILIQTSDLSQTAVYLRSGSEERLHDLWSIGIGGHINPSDSMGNPPGFEHALLAGMERELNEELISRPQSDQPSFLGIISEDETDVGKVHLGAVFRITTSAPQKYIAGPELTQFKWEKTRSLEKLNLELWSSLALKLAAR